MRITEQANGRAVLNIAEHLKVQYAHATPTPQVAKSQWFDLYEKAHRMFEHTITSSEKPGRIPIYPRSASALKRVRIAIISTAP